MQDKYYSELALADQQIAAKPAKSPVIKKSNEPAPRGGEQKTATATQEKKGQKKKPSLDVTNSSQMETFISSLLNEFFSHGDVKEVSQSLVELKNAPDVLARVVDLGILIACDKKDSHRDMLSGLFAHLSKSGFLSESIFLNGLQPLLDSWDDIKVDYPQFQNYMNKFISSAISDGYVTLNSIKQKGIPYNQE